MNNKKTGGLIVAAIIFFFTAVSGVISAYIMRDFWSFLDFSSESGELIEEIQGYDEDIALIYVVGGMYDYGDSFEARISGVYLHQATLAQIDELAYDDNNKGIMLYMNTTGGASQVGDELYLALMEYKELTGRPIYTYMHSYGASAGYYAACASDKIFIERNSITGSIGVIMSTVDYSGLYEKLGIEEKVYTSGDFKHFASEENEAEQDAIYQGIIDEYYSRFVEVVMQGRSMSEQTVLQLADGRIYTANQALDNGLIDEIGDFDYAVNRIYEETGYDVYHYSLVGDLSIFDEIFAAVSNIVPKSDTQVLTELLEDSKPMEVLYVLQD